ncbi:hypothetical protein [Bacillus phage Anath]|uniref:Tail assembly chaperone n=1 Tax=Bacillus phage Anath TaxID=2108114 RepID=A0A2P1JUJ7_9CAUD|nr:hypothetical protein [Bacillus phage Anath]
MTNKMPWLREEKSDFVTLYGVKIHYKKLSYGEQRKIADKATITDKLGRPVKQDVTLAMTLQVVNSITEWELTDREGKVLPISVDTFDNVLDADFVGEIIEVIHPNIDAGVAEGEKKE